MAATLLPHVLLALCLVSAVHGERSASAHLKAGDAAVSRSEWNAAIRHYSNAVDADPKAVLAYTKRAAAHSGLGDHRAAQRDLSAALELDDSVSIRLQRGKLRKSLCDFAGAEGDFRAVLAARPTHRTAEKELDACSLGLQTLESARIAKETGDAAATRAQLATLFDLAERCSEAKLMEATLLMAAKDYSGVVAITGQVLKAEPSHREALLLRSRAYFLIADIDMCKRHLGELLKYDPDDGEATQQFRMSKKLQKLQQKGDRALGRREWKEAASAYIDALWVDRDADALNARIWLGLCKAQIEVGNKDEAVKACTAAADMLRDQPEPRVLKVRALLVAEQWDAAIAEANAARDAHRQDHSVHQVLAEAEKAKKMAERKDYYAILGVVRSATARDVKQAFRHLARRLHPDKAMAEGVPKEDAEKKFHDLAEAAEVLSDDEKRGRYDRGEDVEVQQQQGHPHFQHFQHFGGGAQYHFNFG